MARQAAAAPATQQHAGQHVGSASLADFKQISLLGEGAYSAVYKVMRLADNETYALKKVKLPALSDKEKQNALNEIRLLASIQHENVVAYKEAFFDDKTRCLCIVQECADAGDLLQQINRCKQERSYLREPDIWRYLVGMCYGLKALHDLRILHRDMKCANVFLSASPQGVIAKLGDFNVSKVAKRGLCMTQTGTPYYASPEVWRDMPYDAKSDMWSLGCVLYEMVSLRPPFRAEDMEGLYRKVVRGQYPRIPAHYSQDLAEVIATLLQVHPRHRPSVEQLLQMPVMMRNIPGLKTEDQPRPSDLLSTIKLPKNAIDLSGCLPKPRYESIKVMERIPSGMEDEHLVDLGSVGGGPPVARRQRHANAAAAAAAAAARGSLTPTGSSVGGGGGAQQPPPPPPQRGLGEQPPGNGGGRYGRAAEDYLPRTASDLPSSPGSSPTAAAAARQQPHHHLESDGPSKPPGDALDVYLLERSEPVHEGGGRPPGQAGGGGGGGGGAAGTGVGGRQLPPLGPGRYGNEGGGGGAGLPPRAGSVAGTERGSDRAAPRYDTAQLKPYGANHALAGVNGGRPPRDPRIMEPRRPMSIYAKQQFTAMESGQVRAPSPSPQPPGESAVSKNPPSSGGGRRSRRGLISRLF